MFERIFGRGLEQELTIVPKGNWAHAELVNEKNITAQTFLYFPFNDTKYIVLQKYQGNHVSHHELRRLFESICESNPNASISYKIYKSGRKEISISPGGK